jgi:hypothetical protein
MQVKGNQALFFATDLTDFLACRHLSSLERQAAHGLTSRPFTDDPMLEVLRQRGLEQSMRPTSRVRRHSRDTHIKQPEILERLQIPANIPIRNPPM